MKTRSIVSILAVVSVFSCKEPNLFNRYRDLGSFSSRVEGQNKALAYFLENYNSLPTSGSYRIKYAQDYSPSSGHPENALWYNKGQEILSLETSPPDGPACFWKNVKLDVLEKAVKSSDGLRAVDSLSLPGQPIKTCLL